MEKCISKIFIVFEEMSVLGENHHVVLCRSRHVFGLQSTVCVKFIQKQVVIIQLYIILWLLYSIV